MNVITSQGIPWNENSNNLNSHLVFCQGEFRAAQNAKNLVS